MADRPERNAENLNVLGPFVEGMDNILPEYALPENRLRNAVNVDIADTGHPRRRKGITKRYDGANLHSFWSNGTLALCVDGGDLVSLTESGAGIAATLIRAGIGNRPVSFTELAGAIYYSNGRLTGKIAGGIDRPWGIALPPGYPHLSAAAGGLAQGYYQVAITYADASGEESGASLPGQIRLGPDSALTIAAIPAPAAPGVFAIRVYVSPANGEELYRQASLPPGSGALTVHAVNTGNARLRTAGLQPPPPGDIVLAAFGRLWIASAGTVHYTEAYSTGHYDPARNFIRFAADVSILAAVADGIHIVADGHYFLPGGNPASALAQGPRYGAAKGTAVTIRRGTQVAWFSERGFVIGGPGGEVSNLQDQRVAVDPMLRGAALWRESDGIRQLIAAGRPSESTALTARSYISAEVIRKKTLQ